MRHNTDIDLTRTIDVVKYQNETWRDCAVRLGNEARQQGRSSLSNPFPEGFLSTIWHNAWMAADAEIDP